MKIKFYALVASITLLTSCGYSVVSNAELERLEKVINDSINYKMEYAYFEGQRDALDGDVRIKINKDSCYEWIKTPWGSGKKYMYTPPCK